MRPKNNFSARQNLGYAWAGFKDAFAKEKAFRIWLAAFFPLQAVAFALPIPLAHRIVLSLSLFATPLAEIVNTMIERAVDLVTKEHNELAKQAKDLGSTLVVACLLFTATAWALTLFHAFTR